MHSTRHAHRGPASIPLVVARAGPEIVAGTVDRISAEPPAARPATDGGAAAGGEATPSPLGCRWPLPPGGTTTGVGGAGGDRGGVQATATACCGPASLGGGPADRVLVAPEPGVGAGCRLAGTAGIDPGPRLTETRTEVGPGRAERVAAARVRVGRRSPLLWSGKSRTDRSAHVRMLRETRRYAITWPASTGHLRAGGVVLRDLTEWTPPELVYGAPSPCPHGRL
ncbi:DUF6758 family protein [Micromonospora sp. HM5-17]|uniref:DUF6758 family protein n=1 Tax=Micromonospora sp. HM5-17 TaxID=2487710 RepID=UPI00351357E7